MRQGTYACHVSVRYSIDIMSLICFVINAGRLQHDMGRIKPHACAACMYVNRHDATLREVATSCLLLWRCTHPLVLVFMTSCCEYGMACKGSRARHSVSLFVSVD